MAFHDNFANRTMKNEFEFNILFVGVVKKYEVLYNQNLDGYTNKMQVDGAWQKVAREMLSTVLDCKHRWRSLRVSYMRQIRLIEIGESSLKSKKPYYLTDAMSFLIPYIKSKQSGTAGENNSCKYNDSDVEIEESKLSDHDFSNDVLSNPDNFNRTSEILETNATLEQIMPGPSRIKLEESDLTRSNEFATPDSMSNKKYQHEEDCDLLFLRSLLSDLKQLNSRQKRKFKQKNNAIV